MMTEGLHGMRARCGAHGLILDDAGHCTRCVREGEKQGARSTFRRLVTAALGCVLLLVLYRVTSIGIEIMGAARAARTTAQNDTQNGAAPSGARLVVYTTGYCPACRMAKAWMNDHAVSYEERRVDSDESARRELLGLHKGSVVPTFLVDNDEVLVGFDTQGARLTQSLQKHGLR
jgi:glutaredoxin 3